MKNLELKVKILSPENIKQSLDFSKFVEKIVVEKKRDLYLYKHTRIHLDNVKGLGSFLELETVFYDDVSEDSLIEEHEEVKQRLNLDSHQYVSDSYSDLLLSE